MGSSGDEVIGGGLDFGIVPKPRKGKVLAPAHFGCLGGIPTLNITSGCIFRCAYCYARGYSQAPQEGNVHLYVNLPDLLRDELSRKRTLPPWVILNTSSDCFQSHPDILQVTYEIIQILLNHGIGISFLTKGVIPQRFLDLFGQSSDRILAQIGIVSLSESYWKDYEPGTPSPEKRSENIVGLRKIGINPEVKVDPIIPYVTDTEAEGMALFGRLMNLGVNRVTLSYLHIRPYIYEQLMGGGGLSSLHKRLIESCFGTQEWKEIGSSTKTKLLPKIVRERGYKRLKEIAKRFGIIASVCQCKNPDLKADLCGSGRVKTILGKRGPAQLPLFKC